MDIVRGAMGPEVRVAYDTTGDPHRDVRLNVEVRNPRLPSWFGGEDQATLKKVKLTFDFPDGIHIDPQVSAGPSLSIPAIPPGSLRYATLWPSRDGTPVPITSETPMRLTIEADGVAAQTLVFDQAKEMCNPTTVFNASRSGDRFFHNRAATPGPTTGTSVTITALSEAIAMPSVTLGSHKLSYVAVLATGESLTLGPGQEATLTTADGGVRDVSDRVAGLPFILRHGVTPITYHDNNAPSPVARARIVLNIPEE